MKKVLRLLLLFLFIDVQAMADTQQEDSPIVEELYGEPLQKISTFCLFQVGTNMNGLELEAMFKGLSEQFHTPLLVLRIKNSGGKIMVLHSCQKYNRGLIKRLLISRGFIHLSLKEYEHQTYPALQASSWLTRLYPEEMDEFSDAQ